MALTQKDLIKHIAGRHNLTIKESTEIVKDYWGLIEETVAKKETVSLHNLIKLEPRHRPERIGRNPQTGEEIVLPASDYVHVKALKGLKDLGKGE